MRVEDIITIEEKGSAEMKIRRQDLRSRLFQGTIKITATVSKKTKKFKRKASKLSASPLPVAVTSPRRQRRKSDMVGHLGSAMIRPAAGPCRLAAASVYERFLGTGCPCEERAATAAAPGKQPGAPRPRRSLRVRLTGSRDGDKRPVTSRFSAPAIPTAAPTEMIGCRNCWRGSDEVLTKTQKLKRQRAPSSEELGQVDASQPSHLSSPVPQPASFLGEAEAEAELVQRSQRCRSLSKDSEALEVAPVEPPTNLAQSRPQPSTSDSSWGLVPLPKEQPSAWGAKSPQPSTSPRWSTWPDSNSGLVPMLKEQPSAWSAKIPQSSLSMLPPAARPSSPTPEQRQALRSLSTTDLLENTWVELMERIKPLSSDYAVSQAL